MTAPKFLTLAEAAELARVPVETVRYWTVDGRLRFYKPGRHRLVRLDELVAFIESTGAGGAAAK